jgi:hypothetical protein
MKQSFIKLLSFRIGFIFFSGLLVILFSGIFITNQSAQNKSNSESNERNLVPNRLAVTWTRFFESRVITANSNGLGVFFLPPEHRSFAAWSPDATKIAYQSTQTPRDIFVANGDGSNEVNITNTADPIQETSPSWSITGKIAYLRNNQIWTMNADGSSQTQFSAITQPNPSSPDWSPDGTKLAFASNGEIWVINTDGTNQRRVTTNTSFDDEPDWSPDGTKIIFSRFESGISIVNADGTNETTLTTVSGDEAPAWSPDGTLIAFKRSSASATAGVYTMNANGTNQLRIIADNFVQFPLCCDTIYKNPVWQPVAQVNNAYTISGRITNNNVGLSNVTVNLSGSTTTSTTTDSNGNYQFSSLPIGGNYIVTPSLVGHSFSPAVRSYNNLTSNQTADFVSCLVGSCLIRRNTFDFDGDGRSDISVYRSSANSWYLLRSQSGFMGVSLGASGDVLAPADYDSDLKTDVAIWRPSTGNFHILNSFDNTVRVENFGLAGDIPTVGDYDGDNKADLAVYRAGTQSYFYYRASNNNPQGNITFVPWGTTGDKPVASDYDGDGRFDAAVYRPSNGVWYVRKSTNGQLFAAPFGLANDKLVPADYDADGRTDFAVFRAGIWYILGSTEGFSAYQWGIATDIPAPADYDADGKADIMVFRNRDWFMYKRQTGWMETTTFGANGDTPVPAAYVR